MKGNSNCSVVNKKSSIIFPQLKFGSLNFKFLIFLNLLLDALNIQDFKISDGQ